MSSITVIDMKGDSVGGVDFPDDLIVLNKGDQAVRDVVVAYRAGLRAGTASTLTKAQVAGSNKKPWRQKGLGRARAGYRQSPVWRGGGVAFGPHPRSYAKKITRSVAQLAFRRAFSDKLAGESIRVVQDLNLDEPKTKLVISLMKALKIKGATLVIVDKADKNLALACRNAPGVELVTASDVNTFQLVRYASIIVSQPALPVLEGRMRRGRGAAA